jgi:alpha-tubulin suppressor-like RCC1 family protein
LSNEPLKKIHKAPRFCSFSIGIKELDCGNHHACFLTTTGLVYSMGSNEYGQLGIGEQRVELKNTPILVSGL